jgi:HK97 family phage major capsid protein
LTVFAEWTQKGIREIKNMLTPLQARADRNLDLGLSPKEVRGYSVGRAILASLEPKAEKSFEREVSAVLEQKIGRPPRNSSGLFIPTTLQASGLTGTGNTSGGYTEATGILELVDALRSQMRLVTLGATFLPNLKFTAQFPIEGGTTSAVWTGEDGSVDASQADMSFKAAVGHPHTLIATTAVSRQLLQQTATNARLEQKLRLDVMKSHAEALDAAAINGSGTENQPAGLLQNPGITVLSLGTNGAVPTYSSVIDLEAGVANANAPDAISFLSTPNVRKLLRKTFQNGTGSEPVWEGDTVLGRLALVSTNVPSTLSKGTSNGTLSALIAGVFSELVVCEFGALEILTDVFAQKKRNMVELTSFSMCDIVIPRPAAFAVNVDGALA